MQKQDVPPPYGSPAPQQGYPSHQQGYPSPQQGYPPPQQGYPPPQQGYPPPQQSYAPPQQQQQQVVNNTTVVMAGQPTIVQTTPIRPSDCMGCSIFNLLCCNMLFGAIAVGFSCMARDAFDRGDLPGGRKHATVAKAMNILGPLSILIIAIVFIVVSVTG